MTTENKSPSLALHIIGGVFLPPFAFLAVWYTMFALFVGTAMDGNDHGDARPRYSLIKVMTEMILEGCEATMSRLSVTPTQAMIAWAILGLVGGFIVWGWRQRHTY